ncbi:MAG: peptidase, partial [Rhodoferax sp.]|nr:peptidase [Rhodoferax sp.]
MKRYTPLFGLWFSLLAAAQPAPPLPPSPPSTSPPTAPGPVATPVPTAAATAQATEFTLPNGLHVIVKPDHRAPTAVHMVWVRVGAIDEVDGTSGVAHALEHMMFKGSAKLKPGEFSRQVAALGGRENAFTTRDYTGYYQQIPAGRLEDVVRLEADRFAHNQWPEEEFKKEIEVVKEERRLRTEDAPRALLYETLNAAVFAASPYHRPVVGWMSDLDAMTADDVRNFWRTWYVPANASVVVAGDVDVAEVRRLVEKYYGGIPARPVPARKPRIEPPQAGIRRIDFKAPAEQSYLMMAFRTPSFAGVDATDPGSNDALALTILAEVLDGYPGAR